MKLSKNNFQKKLKIKIKLLLELRCELLSVVKFDNKNIIAGNEVYVSDNKV